MNNASIVSCGALRWKYALQVEPDGSWGGTRLDRHPYANSGASWTLGHVPKPSAHGALIIGMWGKSTPASDRCAVSLASRMRDRVLGGMVIDAEDRDGAKGHHASRARQRAEGSGASAVESTIQNPGNHAIFNPVGGHLHTTLVRRHSGSALCRRHRCLALVSRIRSV
jgi:hypothetical protein